MLPQEDNSYEEEGSVLVVVLWVTFGICTAVSTYLFIARSVLWATICAVLAMVGFLWVAFLGRHANSR